MAGSSIASIVTTEVRLGYGGTHQYGPGYVVYQSPLSITSNGEVSDASGTGILITDLAHSTLTNSGSVIGNGYGVFLYTSDATISNQGFVDGGAAAIRVENFIAGEALVTNSGTLTGANGIMGESADVINSGYIYGSNAGIRLQVSTISNTGTVAGQTGIYSGAGTLTNTGSIHGNSIGISVAGGTATNSGDISAVLSTGARLTNEVAGGVTLSGSLLNAGSVSGGIYGVYAGTGSFTNTSSGRLSGRIGLAENLGAGAANAGVIYGSAYGAELIGRADLPGGASLTNTGSITGGEIGVTLGIGTTLVNARYIYGAAYGVAVYNGYLTNSGSILNSNVGVTLSGGVVVNGNTGSITGNSNGVDVSGGLLTNYGSIVGTMNGAFVAGGSLANFSKITGQTYGVAEFGGNVTNYGLISGSSYGIAVSRGTVTNAGTIAGGIDAIEGAFITLAVEPGALFLGQVANLNGKGLLELAGVGFGTLAGIGSQITGFRNIGFAEGPQWVIEGNQAGLSDGTTIAGFAKGDTIVLDGFSATSDSYIKNIGLELGNGTSTVTLDITGNLTTGSFQLNEASGKTYIAICFAQGTRIATPDGETAVEALKIGDCVRTQYGGTQAVKWIGRRNYDGRFIRGNKRILPVCIKAGAIAEGVPARDLWVSPGHAISIDDVLVHAGRLVNGVSVVQATEVARVAYYHVELENHEIVFAENCPAETFMGEHFRRQFLNAREFAGLYPGGRAPATLCQPRLDHGFQLYAIQRRLRARAGLREPDRHGAMRGYVDRAGPEVCFGWAQDIAEPMLPVSLDILADGCRIGRVLANLFREDVAVAGYGDGYQGFEFPLPAGLAGEIEVRRSADGAKLEMAATPAERAA